MAAKKLGSGSVAMVLGNTIHLHNISREEFLQNEQLFDISKKLTTSGDQLREFAYYAGRVCKNRTSDTRTFSELAAMLEDVSEKEKSIFSDLYQLSKSK